MGVQRESRDAACGKWRVFPYVWKAWMAREGVGDARAPVRGGVVRVPVRTEMASNKVAKEKRNDEAPVVGTLVAEANGHARSAVRAYAGDWAGVCT